jgi:carboxypeptidase Taq
VILIGQYLKHWLLQNSVKPDYKFMIAYRQIQDHFARIGQLGHVQAIIGWDEAVMMPRGGGTSRGQAQATLNVLVHELETDPKLHDLLSKALDESGLDEWQQANLLKIQRRFKCTSALPPDLVEAASKARSRCVQAWRVLRGKNDWQGMLPLMQENLDFARKEARLMGDSINLSPYDALIDQYEPGMTSKRIAEVFSELKTFLPEFIDLVIERNNHRELASLGEHFPIEKQRSLGLKMMQTLGFDFNHGRLDVSHHPFCGGVPDDVRITTRYTEDSFIESLMAVLHETGHAMYEQGLPEHWRGQPVGEALGMAMHESQSLLMEMQACRTREFINYLTPIAREVFGEEKNPAWSSDNLYDYYTRVQKGLIRVDADEVTYPMHIMLRFELEKALISGDLEMVDVPAYWDAGMKDYLGISTAGNYTDGCLQDVHWMEGLFGYFPTYSLGAMTAAQLFAAANEQTDGLLSSIGNGDFAPLLEWLRVNVHGRGSLLESDELLLQATGSKLDPSYFKKHLESRYASLE